MLEKLQKTWKALDRNVTVNKRELVLGISACTLAGVVLGVFLSPKKTTTIGSNNGSNNSGNSASLPSAPEDETQEA